MKRSYTELGLRDGEWLMIEYMVKIEIESFILPQFTLQKSGARKWRKNRKEIENMRVPPYNGIIGFTQNGNHLDKQ